MVHRRQLVGVLILLASQFRPSSGVGDSLSGLIVGQVVDADGGRPVAGAIVVLAGPSAPGGAAHPRILTGTDGRFVYRGLRQGSYQIYASKAGYVDGAHGRTRPAGPSVALPLADGERTADAVVRLWRQASISGTVVDEAGDRLIGTHVQAYRRAIVSGRQRYLPSGSATTDDRGIYRISGLMPGYYIVGAAIRHAAMPLSVTDRGLPGMGPAPGPAPMLPVREAGYVIGRGTPTPPPAQDGRLSIYPPTFHPNAPGADAASIIALTAGSEHLSADLQLRPVPTVSISGDVLGPEGPVTVTPLRLVGAHTAEISLEADGITTMTDRGGRFTFPAVPTGHYSLRMARSVPTVRGLPGALIWVDLPINVGIEDVDDLVVAAQPGLVVGGRIQFEGAGSQRLPSPSAVMVSIEPADPESMATAMSQRPVRADSAGEFRSGPLPGGRYYVRVPNSPSGWMFKSATLAGRDVADTPLDLSAETLDVVLTFTDRWSGLRGFVRNRQGVNPGAAVIVYPTDSSTWASSGLNPRRVRMVRPARSGEYALNLPPGDYYVVAVPDAEAGDWQDPAFLEAASRSASRVEIVEGERQTQDLQTREVR